MITGAQQKMKKITVVTPCYNEEASIETCVMTVRKLFANELCDYEFEHILCDNASTDGTVDILRRLAKDDTSLKVIVNSRNFGPFRSMYNGLMRASGDAVIPFLPVDLQDPPELIPEFVKHWEHGIDVVAGSRETRAEGKIMRAARAIFYRLMNRFSDFNLEHGVGEFQLIDRKVVDAVLSYNDKYPFVRAMIASTGFKRLVVPYHWRPREHGKSRLSILNLIDQALVGLSAFSTAPLRVCIWLGLVVGTLSLLYAISVFFLAVLGLSSAPSGTHSLLVGLFFMFALQFSFFGVLGEYILQIHRQTRGGPVVFEREAINFESPSMDK